MEDINVIKQEISKIVKERMIEKGMTYRKAEIAHELGRSQISRIACAENYNIETLLKLLDVLDLDLKITKK